MKTTIHISLALALAALASCGGSSEEPPAASAAVGEDVGQADVGQADEAATAQTSPDRLQTQDPGLTGPPVPPPPPVAAAAVVPSPAGSAELREGPRSPAEIVKPFLLPEDQRACASPYSPDVGLETPLVVAGETIPVAEIKRHLCLGFGYAYAEFHKFQIIIEQELERREAAGQDVSVYLVSDADLDAYIAKQRAEFATRYPTLDFPTEVGRAYISHELYLEPARQSLVFDRLFLPEDPADWPEVTRELIRGFGGDMFLDDAASSYERRKQRMIDEGLDEIPPDDPIIVGTWKDIVLRGLSDFAEIETYPSRLPPGVLMTVDGQPVTIDAVWGMIAPYVSAVEIDRVRRFMALCQVLENDLQARGKLQTQEEFEITWPKEGQTYRETMNQHQALATQVLGMASPEGYVLYTRLQESMRADMADQLADDEFIRGWIAPTNEVTGAAKRDVEIIMCTAWDGDTASWIEGGWEDARRRIFELKRELDQGADWKALRELHSQFWDPPMPEIGQKPQFGFRFKGAFGQQTRNQLFSLIEENETANFVYGTTITDRIFFEQEVGTIAGPFMGPKGYYITRLTGRTPPLKPLDMSVPLHRELVEGFALRALMHQRAQELLLQGLEDGTVTGL